MSKDAKAVTAILGYLTAQNRPFSANDIVVGLKSELSKTVVQKALDQLALDGKIVDKTFGKQHVYVIHQSNLPTLTESERQALQDEEANLKTKLREKVENNRRLEQEYKNLNSAITTTEAKHQLVECEEKLASDSERLKQLKSSSGPVISTADREKLTKQLQASVREWRKRKTLTSDMMSAVLESYPKSKTEFIEEVGIETDGDLKMPKI